MSFLQRETSGFISLEKAQSYFESKWWLGLGAMTETLPDHMTSVRQNLTFLRMFRFDGAIAKIIL